MAIRFRQLFVGAAVFLGFSIQTAFAANLLQVYQDALKNDPIFKKAEATWLTTKQNLPIAESSLFPTFDINAGLNKNYTKTPAAGTDGFYTTNTYGISLTEQVFNFANWMQISGAKYQVRAATATYMAAVQNLMSRTAQAYINVLKAAARLRFTIAQKNSTWQLYVTSEQKYKVGLIAITPVYDAQARYDVAVSQEITQRNEVHNELENLRAITGKWYTHLYSLPDKQVPLYIPKPKSIDKWTNIAVKQNWGIVANKYNLLYRKRVIQQTAAGNYPTLDASAQWGATNYNHQGTALALSNSTAATVAGLTLNFPFFQGGLITAQTQQQEYTYMQDSAQLLATYRDTVRDTRISYLGIIAGISGVKADRQSVVSNQNSLRATKAGYAVGTRTMVDLLIALTQLYDAQRVYALAQYDYIVNLITLKQNAGTLSGKDLSKINSWLKQNEKLVNRKFANTYTPNNPPPHIKVQGQPEDLSPPPSAPQVQPYGDGPRTGDMPRLNNSDTSSRDVKRDHYGVQLYASNSREAAQSFIVKKGLVGKAEVMRAFVKKRPTYKVMMGNYKTFAKANRARRNLPKALRKLRPWVSHVRAKQHRIIVSQKPKTTKVKAKKAAKKTVAAAKTKQRALPKHMVKATKPMANANTSAVKASVQAKPAKPQKVAVKKEQPKPIKTVTASTPTGELQLPRPS